MVRLPDDLRLDIVRRLSHHGFRELAPFIAAGSEGTSLAFDPRVLQEVDLDEFIFVSPLADENSIYRPFLLKCLDAGNITAKYVVGLRLAVLGGPSEASIQLLADAAEDILYSRFALAAFLICSGSFDQGMAVFNTFFALVPTLEEAIGIGEMVITQIRDMGRPRSGLYDNTLRFGSFPHCFFNNFAVLHLCPRCFAFMYATKIRDLC